MNLEKQFKFVGKVVVKRGFAYHGSWMLKSIPEGGRIKSSVDINSDWVSFNNDLCIGGYLSVFNSEVTLADGLVVAGDVVLEHCDISSFQHTTRIVSGGRLIIQTIERNVCPVDASKLEVYAHEHIRLSLRNMQVPPSVVVTDGYLDLFGSKNIEKLPDKLHVAGDLYIHECKNITSIPKNAHIGGVIYHAGSGITKRYIEQNPQWPWASKVK